MRQLKLPGLTRLTRISSPTVEGPGSDLENLLAAQLRDRDIPEPLVEFRFSRNRLWRFDFAWPQFNLAVEIEGGIWLEGGGRHNKPLGFAADLRKYRNAALAGWTVLRYTPEEVKSGRAVREIEAVIRHHTKTRE